MVEADAMQIGPDAINHRENGPNLVDSDEMSTSSGPYQVHSEARGPHWIAWISRDGTGKPERSIVLVAESREKAEANARRWAEQSSY
jgi:hypothetical protein